MWYIISVLKSIFNCFGSFYSSLKQLQLYHHFWCTKPSYPLWRNGVKTQLLHLNLMSACAGHTQLGSYLKVLQRKALLSKGILFSQNHLSHPNSIVPLYKNLSWFRKRIRSSAEMENLADIHYNLFVGCYSFLWIFTVRSEENTRRKCANTFSNQKDVSLVKTVGFYTQLCHPKIVLFGRQLKVFWNQPHKWLMTLLLMVPELTWYVILIVLNCWNALLPSYVSYHKWQHVPFLLPPWQWER